MINRIKGIRVGLDNMALNELNEIIEEFKEELSLKDPYKYGKLYNIIDENNIFNMKYDYIPKYLDKLIAIIEYIEL